VSVSTASSYRCKGGGVKGGWRYCTKKKKKCKEAGRRASCRGGTAREIALELLGVGSCFLLDGEIKLVKETSWKSENGLF